MRKIVKEFIVYNYDELSKDAQKKAFNRAFERYRNDYIGYSLADDLGAYACEVVRKNFDGAEDIEVLYDLSGCQGSGAMVEFNISIEDLNKKYKKLSKKAIKVLNEHFDNCYKKAVVRHDGGLYYHERSFVVSHKNIGIFLRSEEELDAMIYMFKQDLYKVNEEIAKKGYEYVNNFDFFELCAIDELRDEEFLENGDVYID